MSAARGVPVKCGPETRFLPTRDSLLASLGEARLLCLNSPLNPTGTTLHADTLRDICLAIVEENHQREKRGARPVYLMYDQIYFELTAEGTTHVTPLEIVPEMARYTLFVDGISKAFAATGVRVGWGVGPVDVIDRMSAILGHVGAWAPRAEQIATTKLLDDVGAVRDYVAGLQKGIVGRLTALHDGFQKLKAEGLPVDSLSPEGAIYLTVQVAPFGQTTADGTVLRSNEDVRRYLLDAARVGIVPFQAFGYPDESGWFRLSVGAVSLSDAAECVPRIGAALRALK
jgi:aspartate aminotransferase